MSLDTNVRSGGNWIGEHRLLLLTFVLAAVLAAGAFFATSRLDAGVRRNTVGHLDGVLRSTQSGLEFWFQIHVSEAEAIADSAVVREAAIDLAAAPREMITLGAHPAAARFRSYVRPALERSGYLDSLIVGADNVVLAAARDGLVGTRIRAVDYHKDRLSNVFQGRTQFLPPILAEHVSPFALGILTPIRASDDAVVAVLVLQIDSRGQFSGLTHSGRFGESVEIYSFDEQGRLLTDTRFDEGLRQVGLLRGPGQPHSFVYLRDPGADLFGTHGPIALSDSWPPTRMADAATQQHGGHDASGYRNILGRRVLGAWTYSQELGIGLGIEIAEDEALAGYRTLHQLVLASAGLVACFGLVLVGGYVLHRRRVRRIMEDASATFELRVAERTRELASANGRLALEVNERRSSESRLRAVQAMLEETTEKYARLSQIDPLTELANRRRFDEFLEREWRRCIRNHSQMSLLWIDVDYFKLFNDTYGHGAGDECLRALAEVLSAAARRPGDLAARVGGEEFAIVLCDTGSEGAIRVARQIHAWIEDLAIEHDTTQVAGIDNVTVSIGVASMQPELTSNPSVLVYHADEALYAAKQDGRNAIRTYEVDTNDIVDYDETHTRTKGLKAHELITRTYR